MSESKLKSFYKNNDTEAEVYNEQLIEKSHVLSNSSTQEYAKIIELVIENEKITKIDKDNQEIRKLAPTLRKLNLSYNLLSVVSNLDCCQNLRDLTINNNKLTRIEGLSKLLNLKSLSLDRNKFTKIEGIK
jgi:protein phosphatase 1 regulatory subunit 7